MGWGEKLWIGRVNRLVVQPVRHKFRKGGDEARVAPKADGATLAGPEHPRLVAATLGIGGQLNPALLDNRLVRVVTGHFGKGAAVE